MRCVTACADAKGPPPTDRPSLEATRYIGRRFPSARVRETPLVRAAELDMRADPSGQTRVWLALEALQVTGSFQVRGALLVLASVVSSGRGRSVVASSMGNFGIAVAYGACVLGLSATVVVPRTTVRTKRAKIQRYGAELVVAATDEYDTAEALAKEIAVTQGAAFVAPTEDVDILLGGGGSLGFEIVRGLGGVPERVLVPLSTGALATGLALAFATDAKEAADRTVWAVQPEHRCAMATLLERPDALPQGHGQKGPSSTEGGVGGPSLADEILASPSSEALGRARAAIAGAVVVSEAQIAAAMEHAYHDMGLVLEGSAAMALAPVLFGVPDRLCGGDLVVVLTGRNVDPERLDAVLAQSWPSVG